jgi:hypothetical protein
MRRLSLALWLTLFIPLAGWSIAQADEARPTIDELTETVKGLKAELTQLKSGYECKATCLYLPAVFGGASRYRVWGELSAVGSSVGEAWQALEAKCGVREPLSAGWTIGLSPNTLGKISPEYAKAESEIKAKLDELSERIRKASKDSDRYPIALYDEQAKLLSRQRDLARTLWSDRDISAEAFNRETRENDPVSYVDVPEAKRNLVCTPKR